MPGSRRSRRRSCHAVRPVQCRACAASDAVSAELEATDRKILELLAADGRMSFTDLGKATGLSTSAVHQRVKRLEQRGLILGYGATVNHDEIGLPLTAFISIRPIDPSQPDDSPERLRDIPEIESCWSVAGEESYILKVRVATPGRPRGPAGPGPRGRERLDPHHDRAVDALREPADRSAADGSRRASWSQTTSRCRVLRWDQTTPPARARASADAGDAGRRPRRRQ